MGQREEGMPKEKKNSGIVEQIYSQGYEIPIEIIWDNRNGMIGIKVKGVYLNSFTGSMKLIQGKPENSEI